MEKNVQARDFSPPPPLPRRNWSRTPMNILFQTTCTYTIRRVMSVREPIFSWYFRDLFVSKEWNYSQCMCKGRDRGVKFNDVGDTLWCVFDVWYHRCYRQRWLDFIILFSLRRIISSIGSCNVQLNSRCSLLVYFHPPPKKKNAIFNFDNE